MSNDLVFKGENGQILTNSLLVAEKFGKKHKDVIEGIRTIKKAAAENSAPACENVNTSAEFSADIENQELALMFDEVEYEYVVNGAKRKAPMYVMNRDGFSLLVMGFTGKKALQFKLEYINAFNRMEKQLAEAPKLDIAQISRRDLAQMLLDSENELEAANRRIRELEAEKANPDSRIDRLEKLLLLSIDHQQQAVEQMKALQEERIVQTTRTVQTVYKRFAYEATDNRKLKAANPGCMRIADVGNRIQRDFRRAASVELLSLWFREKGYVFDDEDTYNRPSQECLESGWMICYRRGRSHADPKGKGRYSYTYFITQKGYEKFSKEYVEEIDSRRLL